MRKLTVILVVLAALVAASVAVAHGIQGAKSLTAVSATFSASTSNATTRTCTTTDGKTLTIVDAKYTGNANGSGDLTGAITLRARSVVNTTDAVGTVNGTFRIDVAQGRDTIGAFSAVYDHGSIAGLATGRAHAPGAKLLANVSATFTPGSSFQSGLIGHTSGGGAVEIATGRCKPEQTHPEHSDARGSISSLSASSITVAGLTCAIPSDKSAAVTSRFKQGDRVEIRCAYSGGQNTLARIAKHH
ncbi:MAG TPA: hypothetical protein VFI04_00020 [Gaiellaceae bacterium]|jgi:hypothetical protein|nr:hypothetical protein [Gaiellaceae bacterium]